MYADGDAWLAGPDRVYRLLARAAVDLLPGDLHAAVALDAGAGTGAATGALRARGARTIACDRSVEMVRGALPPSFVADVVHLPLRTATMDVAVAYLVLSHVDEPAAAWRELVRVTRPGGLVSVSAFPAGASHPVKEAADRVLAAAGFPVPEWYRELKTVGEARVGSAAALHALARSGVAADAYVERCRVDVSCLDRGTLTAWRLGMAPVAAYLSGLDAPARREVTARVARAVSEVDAREPLELLVLVARA